MGIQPRPGSLKLMLAAVALCIAPAWLAGQQPTPVQPAQKLEAVKQSFEDKQAEFRKNYGKVKDEAERKKLSAEYQASLKQLLKDARAIAEAEAGTETAAEGWAFVLTNAPQVGNMELAGKAFDILIAKHLASPAWKELAPTIGGLPSMGLDEEKVDKALHSLMEKSPHKLVQAAAMFSLGDYLTGQSDELKHTDGLALLERVSKEFADVKEAQDYVKRAEGTMFRIEKLQPGMPVPDFEASDENGVKFKLSDYKGKVVLIDFWGFW